MQKFEKGDIVRHKKSSFVLLVRNIYGQGSRLIYECMRKDGTIENRYSYELDLLMKWDVAYDKVYWSL